MTVDSNGNFHLNGLKKTDNQVVTCRATQSYGKKQKLTIFKSGYINVISKCRLFTPMLTAAQKHEFLYESW
jgi:hypothetical protein